MKWIVFAGFVVISFTALAAEGDKVQVKPRKLNFRTLASVSNDVQQDIAYRVEDTLLRKEEEKYLEQKEEWLKTLEYMEKNSFREQK